MRLLLCCGVFLSLVSSASAQVALHAEIDRLIAAKASSKPVSALADDAEFLRRVTLDLRGYIPSATETREFLADTSADKRAKKIDALLAAPEYAERMKNSFHIMLMERMGDHPEWLKWLKDSFAANKPWDQMAKSILRADPDDKANLGAAFFYAKRLENYGQQEVDYPALTRDVGRLFLGKDLRCAQCHDHLFIKDYKQQDFQGLFAFYRNAFLNDIKNLSVGEKPTTAKLEFQSVFRKVKKETAPAVPGLMEVMIPALKMGEEYEVKPDPRQKKLGKLKFSPLVAISETLPVKSNDAFVRNGVNRLWFLLMGRGLVHPLDLAHSENPPSHPELLDLLAKEFVAHQFDMKYMLKQIALSQTYQRSSVLPKGVTTSPPELFLTAIEKRMSAEQLTESFLVAIGLREHLLKTRDPKTIGSNTDHLGAISGRFVRTFAGPNREPEEEFTPSLKGALFLLNDSLFETWVSPRDNNLVERLLKLDDPGKAVEEMYLSILTRLPTTEEKTEAIEYLKTPHPKKAVPLTRLVWALLASMEFQVNH